MMINTVGLCMAETVPQLAKYLKTIPPWNVEKSIAQWVVDNHHRFGSIRSAISTIAERGITFEPLKVNRELLDLLEVDKEHLEISLIRKKRDIEDVKRSIDWLEE